MNYSEKLIRAATKEKDVYVAGYKKGFENGKQTVTSEVETALDEIIAMQEALIPKQLLTFTHTCVWEDTPTTYEFEEGMTWFEWCNSKYNTTGFVIGEFDAVYTSDYLDIHKDDGTVSVYSNDLIIANHEYFTT